VARLTAADLAAVPDFEKLLVADWEVARNLGGYAWTPTGAGSWWLPFTDGEVHKIATNSTVYAETFDVGSCDSTVSSFYMDLVNQRIYIHMVDSDAPDVTVGGEYKYCIMTYFFVGLVNDGAALRRYRELLVDGRVDLWSNVTTLRNWGKTITGMASLDREDTVVYDGLSAHSAKLTVGPFSEPGDYICIFQYGIIRPSGQVMIRLKYKCVGAIIPKIKFTDALNANIWLKDDCTWTVVDTTISLPNSTSWTEYSITFNAHASYSYYRLFIICDQNGSFYADNIELKRFYEPSFFLPYLSGAAIPSIRHSVGSFCDPSEQVSFGELSLNDDGFFLKNFDNYIWEGKQIYFLLGQKGATYDELAPMFTGIARLPKFIDGKFSVDITEVRAEWKNLLQTTFDAATYPNCEDNWKEKAIPILQGNLVMIQPPQQDTVGRVYRISETNFGGAVYPLYAVTSVFINGVGAVQGVDWTYDLSAGTITLLTGSPTDTILCSAASYRFNAALAPTYQVWDWLWIVMTAVQGIPEDSINLKGFLTANAKRVLLLSKWYSGQISIRDVANAIMRSGQAFFFLRSDGQYFLRVLESVVPSDAPHFYDEDFRGFESWFDTDGTYMSVTASFVHSGYGTASPPGGLEHTAINIENRPEWERGIKGDFPLDLIQTIDSEAALLAGRLGDILMYPPEMIKVNLPAQAIFLEPTDKIYISKTIVDADGVIQTQYAADIFIVLEIEKNLNECRATITAIKSRTTFYWEETS